jgi:hypothetical protein
MAAPIPSKCILRAHVAALLVGPVANALLSAWSMNMFFLKTSLISVSGVVRPCPRADSLRGHVPSAGLPVHPCWLHLHGGGAGWVGRLAPGGSQQPAAGLCPGSGPGNTQSHPALCHVPRSGAAGAALLLLSLSLLLLLLLLLPSTLLSMLLFVLCCCLGCCCGFDSPCVSGGGGGRHFLIAMLLAVSLGYKSSCSQ